jgi:hypothetical protein
MAFSNLQGTTNGSFQVGTNGPTVYKGPGVPSNSIGVDGDVYIRNQNGSSKLYQRKSGRYVPLQSLEKNVVTKTSDYQTTVIDEVILVDTTANVVTITLGNTGTFIGREVLIKDITGTSATNNIIIVGQSGQTIDGDSSYTINLNKMAIRLICDGTNWQLF